MYLVRFLSTPPSRVATIYWRRLMSACNAFLSTPPSRVATVRTMLSYSGLSLFLSTPPSRVATNNRPQTNQIQRVSIHATLAGGDVANLVTISVTGTVSIHATLAGGDWG